MTLTLASRPSPRQPKIRLRDFRPLGQVSRNCRGGGGGGVAEKRSAGLSIGGRLARREVERPDQRAGDRRSATMAQYLILIYGDEKAHEQGGQELWDQLMKGHTAFAETHGPKIAGGNALQPTTTATTVRDDGSKVAVTDGPFAETKEALGGYYLVEAKDLDEAIAIAKDVPAPVGGVEVRPVMVFD